VNRQIRRLGVALIACFTILFVQLNYIQVVRQEELNDDPRNSRKIVEEFSRPRGTIISADGAVLARSTESNDAFKFQREYPEGELFGHVTGYFNFNFGATGLEATYGDELSGRTPEIDLRNVSDLFVDDEDVGDLTITIRKDVQQLARDALGNQAGSVVAVDPRDGSILAFWSNPSFDPNPLSAHDRSASEVKEFLEAAPGKPLLPKMYRELFFPGSTFKVVTGSIGVDTGKVTPDQPVYPVETGYDIDFTDRDLSNFGGSACGGTLFEILRVSCNSAFARMGDETIGAPGMVQGAERFGFNARPPIDLPAAAASRFPTEFPADQGNGPIARASIGQGDTSSTPLQMALVAAAVANEGRIMAPHLLQKISDPNGSTIREAEGRVWKEAMSPASAATMRQGMIGVVQGGTANRLAIPGFEVGGKTGTAQLGTEPPRSHAWIIGFAGEPGQPARVAVAVIVEGQPGASEQTGGRVAAPIAQAVMAKVLQTQ
jgi:peptidoglycan glycosyltransferase